MKRLMLLIAIGGLAGGCSEDDDCSVAGSAACTSDEVRACREEVPTVATGVFGCVTSTSDVGPPRTTAFVGRRVDLVARPDVDVALINSAVSDEIGFYEIAAGTGTFEFCTPGDITHCSQSFTLGGPPLAVDVSYGVSPFWTER